MNKDLISGFDLSDADIKKIFALTSKLKKKKIDDCLKNKTIAFVFQKPSVRTRVSFEVGASQLGANCLYLAPHDIELGSREPLKDVARVFSRYLDGIIARTFSHDHVLELAKYADIPIINGLSDLYHPAQALADIYTIAEYKKSLKGVKLVYVGDGNNVVNSLIAICAKVGMDFTISTPKGFEPNKLIWDEALKIAKQSKAKLVHSYDPKEAVKGADFIYSDVWTSMGQEKQAAKRIKIFKNYQINSSLLKYVGKKYKIMHCMPIHRGQEMTDEVVESKQSIIFEQAENRMHVQKAVMSLLIK